MSSPVIRRALLREMSAYGSGLTAVGLLELVKIALPQTTLADVIEELSWLRDNQLANSVENSMAPGDRALRQWTITTAGELMLKK